MYVCIIFLFYRCIYTRRKTTWDTIRTTESNSIPSNAIKESKTSSTSVEPSQYIPSDYGSNPYRRRTPRIGIQKLRSVSSNSNKLKNIDEDLLVDKTIGDSLEGNLKFGFFFY